MILIYKKPLNDWRGSPNPEPFSTTVTFFHTTLLYDIFAFHTFEKVIKVSLQLFFSLKNLNRSELCSLMANHGQRLSLIYCLLLKLFFEMGRQFFLSVPGSMPPSYAFVEQFIYCHDLQFILSQQQATKRYVMQLKEISKRKAFVEIFHDFKSVTSESSAFHAMSV